MWVITAWNSAKKEKRSFFYQEMEQRLGAIEMKDSLDQATVLYKKEDAEYQCGWLKKNTSVFEPQVIDLIDAHWLRALDQPLAELLTSDSEIVRLVVSTILRKVKEENYLG